MTGIMNRGRELAGLLVKTHDGYCADTVNALCDEIERLRAQNMDLTAKLNDYWMEFGACKSSYTDDRR